MEGSWALAGAAVSFSRPRARRSRARRSRACRSGTRRSRVRKSRARRSRLSCPQSRDHEYGCVAIPACTAAFRFCHSHGDSAICFLGSILTAQLYVLSGDLRLHSSLQFLKSVIYSWPSIEQQGFWNCAGQLTGGLFFSVSTVGPSDCLVSQLQIHPAADRRVFSHYQLAIEKYCFPSSTVFYSRSVESLDAKGRP